uniref:Uncharacterized protein AlNc14C5G741 n=1 Tax=Albugo laibachii Nc14 TaxID=890382 RepID=F0W0W1_9STRA|nr:conserved hypothetical protein [Albugo laibachii Nc14]|eukprot:CCA14685.1 conserved hypothetical protein [Albugo laibachii Nc14]
MQSAVILLIGPALSILFHAVAGDGFAFAGDGSIKLCLRRLSTNSQLLNTTSKATLCSVWNSDSYVRCVITAIKHKSLQYYLKQSDATAQDMVASFLIQLCSNASNTGPTKCLNVIPAYVFPKSHDSPLLGASLNWTGSLCAGALDDKPAGCVVELHRLIGTKLDFKPNSGNKSSKRQSEKALELCRKFDGDPTLFTKCVKAAPRTLDLWTRFHLCRAGKDYSGVVGCASTLTLKGFPHAIIPQVCASISMQTIEQTTKCILTAQHKLRWMEVASQAKLCANTLRLDPIDCAISTRKSRTDKLGAGFGVLEIVKICSDDIDPVLMLDCMEQLHASSFNAADRLRVCRTKENVGREYISKCVISALEIFGQAFPRAVHQSHVIELCKNAAFLAPLQCVRNLVKTTHLTIEQLASLCNQATSNHRQKCYEFTQTFKMFSADQGIGFCAATHSNGPTECLKNLFRLTSIGTFKQSGLSLCKNASSKIPAKCFDAAPSKYSNIERSFLCNEASSIEPAKCASITISRLSHAEQSVLCNKASSIQPALCALETPHKLSSEEIVHLCRHAQDIIPAKCALIASTSSFIPSAVVVELCQKATTTTPAKCLLSFLSKRAALSPQVISHCRQAFSIPTSLAVNKVTHACPSISPDCPLTFIVQAFDQYGDHFSSLNEGVVRVTVSKNTSTTPTSDVRYSARFSGGSIAKFANGTANFSELQFKEAGSFVVHFRSDQIQNGSKGEAVIRVSVRPSKHDIESTRCENSFARCVDHIKESSGNGPALDIIFIALPIQLRFQALYCEKYWSETMGMSYMATTFDSALYEINKATYDLVRAGPSLPHEKMDAWGRLGIAVNASHDVIRKSYHRAALKWHPDRWRAQPQHLQKKVHEIFWLITSAYEALDAAT